ncbi:hypothetical protein PENPOL_c015G10718 [Penicillium polonicum]|uniref:Uncharacterized protein n=1 Tax=Penicillium polonicum TaxID=60169 RepID=A0A1V6NAS3_PENPO|nr:hypothetical protein PENPOL_c015G10718 [Penicillium polonicum]
MGARSGLALVPVSGRHTAAMGLHSARDGRSNQSMYTSTYSAQAGRPATRPAAGHWGL